MYYSVIYLLGEQVPVKFRVRILIDFSGSRAQHLQMLDRRLNSGARKNAIRPCSRFSACFAGVSLLR